MEPKKNLTDITHMSDAALDVVIAAKTGADWVDCGHLTGADRYQVAVALNWPMNARTRAWIADSHLSERRRDLGPDYEQLILEEQDDRFQD